MRYLKPLRPFLAWSQLSIPTVYDDSLSYYEVLNKCIFHFNEMLKIMQENYEIIDEAFAKILEECEAAIARCEEAAARAEAAQSAAEKAQAAAEAAQAAAEAAQKLAEAAQAAAEAARDDAVTAQKAAEAAQAAAEAAQAAAEAAQQKAETAQAAAEAAQAKAEDAQEKAESARDAAQAAQTAAEAAQQKAEEAQSAAESARDAAQAAQQKAEAAQEAAEASEQAAADSAADAAASAEEIKNALDNYYDKTESDNTFVKKAGDTMTGNLVMNTKDNPNNGTVYLDGAATRFRTIYLTGAQDFNNLLLNGIYSRSGTTSGDKNYPSTLDGSNFVLIVIAGASSKIIKQIFFNYGTTPDIYIRFSSLNDNEIEFGSWEKISKLSDIPGNYLPLSGGTMTGKLVMESGEKPNTSEIYLDGASKRFKTIPLSGNQDFNTLTKNGVYCRSGGTGTDTNAPLTYRNFTLVVIAFDKSNNIIKQIYFAGGVIPNVYIRFIYATGENGENTVYGNWEKIALTAEINNSLSGYLPLTGGTMSGNITMSADTKLIGNAETSDFFKLIHIPNASDMNKIIDTGFYAIVAGNNVSNAPEGISGGNNAFSCFVFPWWYPSTTGIAQLAFGGQEKTVKGVYFRLTNNPDTGWSDWVRLDNITEEPTNGTPIFYKRTYSTDNKFFANIYKIAGDERKAKVDIYVNNLDSNFNLNFSTSYNTFPVMFKIDETQSTFNGENLPFNLKTTMDLVIGNYMVEKGSKYIGLVNLNYIIGFSGGNSYIKPYFNGILLESSVLNRGTVSGTYPVFITSFINDVNPSWSWD